MYVTNKNYTDSDLAYEKHIIPCLLSCHQKHCLKRTLNYLQCEQLHYCIVKTNKTKGYIFSYLDRCSENDIRMCVTFFSDVKDIQATTNALLKFFAANLVTF
jgi:hypothetical protein